MIPTVFNRWQGVAFSLLTSGVGLGNLAFPFIIKKLEETYGWRGSFLMLSGIALHICFCGSLLGQAFVTPVQTDLNGGSHQGYELESEDLDTQKDSTSDGKILQTNCKMENFEMVKTSDAKIFQTNNMSGTKTFQMDSTSDKKSFKNRCQVEAKNLQMDKTSGAKGFQNTCKTDSESLRSDSAPDAQGFGRECTLNAKSNQIDHKSTATNLEMERAGSLLMNWKTKLKSFFHFLSPSILILTCSNFLYFVGYSVFTNHMPAFTLKELDLELSERSSMVPSVGISTILASWIQGALLDILSIDCQVLYMVCYFAMGIAVGCVPFVTSYAGMLGLCVLFGFTYAANGAALAKITLLYSGSANFVSSYGCVNLGGGVGIVLGGPMAGEYPLA